VLGSLPLAALLVWHFREQTGLPASLAATALVMLIVLVPIATLERLLATRAPLPQARITAVAAVLVAAILLAGWYTLPTFRWHLLRHNTLLGTPLYYALAPPVPEIREELHASAERLDDSSLQTEAPEAEDGEASAISERPDFVFVLVDTLRADALSDWGGSGEAMPELETLARSSLRFTDLVANSSWTRPSVASMLTGLLPEEHGARDVHDPIAPGVETLAQRLSARGYRTVGFQTNVGAAGRGAGFGRGFDLFRELPRDPYARAEEVNRELRRWLDAEYAESDAADEEKSDDDRPLFLYLHYLDPHEPYLSGDFEQPPVTAREYLERYDAELAYFDARFAEILSGLRQVLGEDTLLLVTSDHGEEFFEHGLFGHGHSLYDEVVEIPLIVHQPGAAPAVIDARLEGRDLFDLVLALGADAGLDLTAWATGQERERRYLSLEYTGSGRLALRPYRRNNLMRALDTPERRFIWSGYGPTRELYDQRNDPEQLDNRIERERDIAAALEAGLDDMVPGWRFPEPIDPSDEALEQLRALGYVD
jgi:arylsulfatase A-like enzyme